MAKNIRAAISPRHTFPKNIDSASILAECPPPNQVISELLYYISSGALTQAVELLQESGIAGDTAFFLLASIHHMGAQR